MKVRDMVRQYIVYRRAIGDKFESAEEMLNTFVKYVGEDADIQSITSEVCEKYLVGDDHGSTRRWLTRHMVLNGLFKWAIAREILSHNPLPKDKPREPEHMKPYIYSNDELRLLFDCALKYQRGRCVCYPESMQCILRLTYMLGLRIRETLNIKISDIDMKEQTIYIQCSKFFKSRIVPYNTQVQSVLQEYITWRGSNEQPMRPDSLLFLDRSGNALRVSAIENNYARVRKLAGIKRDDDSPYQPRIHDLRHSFAVHRLTAWYDDGVDVQKMLPVLSTYMGHSQLAHTSIYLTMTDRLLGLANNRFEIYAMGGMNHE